MSKTDNQSKINIILTSILLISLILYFGKFLLLPLSLAIFIFVIIKSLSEKLITFTKNNLNVSLNSLFSLILILSLFLMFFYSFWKILEKNLVNVIQKSDYYQNNLIKIANLFSDLEINRFVEINNLF